MAWTIGTITSSTYSASAGATNSAIVPQRRRARARRARRIVGAGCASRPTTALSGLGGIRDLAGDGLRRGLAREQLLHRVVDRLPDRRRVRLVEVELDEARLPARIQHRLHVRIGHRALTALDHRQDRAALAALVSDLGAHQIVREVDGLGRRVLAEREAVSAAELLGRLAGAAGHGR